MHHLCFHIDLTISSCSTIISNYLQGFFLWILQIQHLFLMDQERLAIIEIFMKGNRPSKILTLLKMPKQKKKFVYRTIQRYRKIGSVNDMPRSGRPKSTTLKLNKIVLDRIRRNPRRSLRKMAAELKVPRGSL